MRIEQAFNQACRRDAALLGVTVNPIAQLTLTLIVVAMLRVCRVGYQPLHACASHESHWFASKPSSVETSALREHVK